MADAWLLSIYKKVRSMFFLMPMFSIFGIYLLLALAPALILMNYVYKQDKIERESPALLGRLVLMGVLAGFLSMVLEGIGENILGRADLNPNSAFYKILLSFLVVGLVEEGMKYLLMSRVTWRNPEFNYKFDAIVYSVFTSLGFAGMENIMYAMNFGPSVLAPRAFLAIPGHCAFAVVFGAFYGRAKMRYYDGYTGRAVLDIIAGYLLSVCFHGLYDSCAMIGTGMSSLIMAAVIVVIYIVIFKVVKYESERDRRL